MLQVSLQGDRIQIGERFALSLMRTLRIPDDGKTYPLPPGLGRFPVHPVTEFADRLPAAWRERGGYFIPLYQREAMWLQFEAAFWKPNAAQIAVGGINAITGERWSPETDLRADPQNYIVCPDQPWLDGVHTAGGTVRQFVAVALGRGDTVEEQLTGAAEYGGLQVRVFEPKPGRFPDKPPDHPMVFESMVEPANPEGDMGFAAGGQIQQKIYPDHRGIDTWDQETSGETFIHVLNSRQYRAVTGQDPPPSPVTPELYTSLGLPWFELYDEHLGDVPAGEPFGDVKSLREREEERGEESGEKPVNVNPDQILPIPMPGAQDPDDKPH
jgi:hypothetical protein